MIAKGLKGKLIMPDQAEQVIKRWLMEVKPHPPMPPFQLVRGEAEIPWPPIPAVPGRLHLSGEAMDLHLTHTSLSVENKPDEEGGALTEDVLVRAKLFMENAIEKEKSAVVKDLLYGQSAVFSSSFFGNPNLYPPGIGLAADLVILKNRLGLRSPKQEAFQMAMDHLTIDDLLEILNKKLLARKR